MLGWSNEIPNCFCHLPDPCHDINYAAMLSFKPLSDGAAFIRSESSANAQADAYLTEKPWHVRSTEHVQ